MTGHFILRPRALRDLEDIWDYTIANWGARQAESYVRQVNEAFEALAENPNLGRSCEQIRVGYRKYLVGFHVVFYREVGDVVEVVRILHGRMDVNRKL
jgi:toxin ParE1/3/4